MKKSTGLFWCCCIFSFTSSLCTNADTLTLPGIFPFNSRYANIGFQSYQDYLSPGPNQFSHILWSYRRVDHWYQRPVLVTATYYNSSQFYMRQYNSIPAIPSSTSRNLGSTRTVGVTFLPTGDSFRTGYAHSSSLTTHNVINVAPVRSTSSVNNSFVPLHIRHYDDHNFSSPNPPPPPPSGSIKVTIEPPEAVSAGATWICPFSNIRSSGDVVSGLKPGVPYTVYFDAPPSSGFFAPVGEVITVNADQTLHIVRSYPTRLGKVCVTVFPEEQRTKGALWKLNAATTNWYESGEIVELPVGAYEIIFDDFRGWSTPEDITFEIIHDHVANLNASYVPWPQHSSDNSPFDWVITRDEAERLISFWHAGSYHIDPSSPDGFSPGSGPTNGVPHSSDWNSPHWSIDTREVSRILAFWRSEGLTVSTNSVDGYSPLLANGSPGEY